MNRESTISIKHQLQLYFVLALGFIVLVMGGAWITYDQVMHKEEAERVLMVESEIIGAAVRPALMFDDRQLAGELLHSIQFDTDIWAVTLFNADKKILYNYRAKGDDADSSVPIAFQNSNKSIIYAGGTLRLYRVVTYKNRPVGAIFLESHLTHMQENRFVGIITVVLTMLGCLVVGLVLASRLQHKIAEPVSSLAKLMRQMSVDGDYSLRTTSPGFNRETEELLVGFDQMAAKIQRSFAEAEEHHKHLHQSEERFRTIVELAPVPVIITRPSDGQLLFYNQAALKLFGMVADGGSGPFSAPDFYQHPEQRQQLMQRMETEGEVHGYELEVVGPDGAPFWISLSMSVMNFEGSPALFSAFVDITEQKNIEQVLEKNNQLLEQRVVERTAALQATRDELQSTLDNMIDTYYRIRADGVVERASASVFSLLGYQPSEIAGLSLQALSVDGQQFTQLADALRQHDGAIINQKVQLKHKSGHAIWASISARVMKDEQGELTGVEGVVRDISQQVQADLQKQEMENKMTHVQRLESLGILAGGIAHDFNNILAAIMGNAELAQLNALDGLSVQQELKNIIGGSARAADLCKQMLAYSGQGIVSKSEVNITTLVEEELQLIDISISKNISLKLELSNTLPSVCADKTQVQQVIMNLVTNAAESIGEEKQGDITIMTTMIQADSKALACRYIDAIREPGAYVLLEVTDNGCGMDDATMERIFDPFFTTKFTGRGLGMSAVLGIVRAHGGTIQIDSEQGHGTCFRILLPVSGRSSSDQVKAADKTMRPHNLSCTVLVVDDEMMVRKVVERLLGRLGCKVVLAANGKEAVEVFRQHRQEIDVVLLDMTMPIMGGKEALKELRNLESSLPVFICSGYRHESVADMFDEVQPSGFLQKPFSLNILNDMLTGLEDRA